MATQSVSGGQRGGGAGLGAVGEEEEGADCRTRPPPALGLSAALEGWVQRGGCPQKPVAVALLAVLIPRQTKRPMFSHSITNLVLILVVLSHDFAVDVLSMTYLGSFSLLPHL